MIWTAWNNGRHHTSGAGYGFKIVAADRDRHFKRAWDTATVELPQASGVLAGALNTAKDSFWSEPCREVIHQAIGRWFRGSGYAPWPPLPGGCFDTWWLTSAPWVRCQRRIKRNSSYA